MATQGAIAHIARQYYRSYPTAVASAFSAERAASAVPSVVRGYCRGMTCQLRFVITDTRLIHQLTSSVPSAHNRIERIICWLCKAKPWSTFGLAGRLSTARNHYQGTGCGFFAVATPAKPEVTRGWIPIRSWHITETPSQVLLRRYHASCGTKASSRIPANWCMVPKCSTTDALAASTITTCSVYLCFTH